MFEYELQIDKPVREVYRAFNDPDNLPRWLSGLQRYEHISGTPGEVGSKNRQIYLERGRTVELIETITAHEPEKHFAGRLEGQGINAAIEVDFVDRGQTTLVRLRSGMESEGFVMSLMMPFVRASVRKRQQGDLRRFKQLVETGEISGES
jgi:uncharacterized membrane protein